MTKVKSAINNTAALIQQMLDNNDRIMEENKARNARINEIEKGMQVNNTELVNMRSETNKSIRNITKEPAAVFTKISGSDIKCLFDDWEFDDDSTLEELLLHTQDSAHSEKKRKNTKNPKTLCSLMLSQSL